MSAGPTAGAPEALLGRVLGGKLRIDALLGSGSMGHVFRARHQTLDKDVAIKVLRQLEGQPEVHSRRFAHEARAASRFDHPHAVAILDFGEDEADGLLYLVMELVDGEDLQQIIDRHGPMALRRACDIMEQTLGAVAAAHDVGIVHRDLKPSNLIVTQRVDDDGQLRDFVKVCDFGLAKFVAGTRESLDGSAASAAKVAGTPAYMSPEQAVGEALDVRTDLYSCGVILFEMLTGKLPFDSGTAMGVMLKHVSEPPPAPRTLAPHLPEAVDDIVLWALTKPREGRCQSARDLRQALQQLRRRLSGELVAISLTTGTRSSADWTPAEPLPESALLPSPTDDLHLPAPTSSPTNTLDLVSDLGFDLPPSRPEPPAPSSSAPDSDLDMEALVNEAVESVREERSRDSTPLPEHSLVAGFDPRKVGAEVSDRATYMWRHYGITYEPYEGAHPFWVKDHRDLELGPLNLEDATRIIRIEGNSGLGHQVEVANAERHWVTAATYVKLSGQEDLLDREMHAAEPRASGLFTGALDKLSLPGLFARLSLDAGTGRLSFRLSVRQEPVAFEIHLVQGRPTFVYANESKLQLPQLLVGQGLVQDHLLPGLLQSVIGEELPLEDVVARVASMDISPYRATFMRERLRYLFRHPTGTFAFDTQVLPARTEPFAPTLLAVLPELVYTATPEVVIEAKVHGYLHVPLRRSERFGVLAKHLRLSKGQVKIAQQILAAPTIADAIPAGSASGRLYYAMAYILVECGLLLPPL